MEMTEELAALLDSYLAADKAQRIKHEEETDVKLRGQDAKLREQDAKLWEQDAKLREQDAKLLALHEHIDKVCAYVTTN